jgi:D-glycero-alpha-D-manno-heptose 1-phosphate guanylyltransferase
MVPVLGKPFLEYIVRQLAGQGIEDIIISTGYKGDQIESYFRSVAVPARLRCIREEMPLGTGGALAFVLSHVASSEWILAANGDSLASFSLHQMISRAQSGADAVLIGVHVPAANRFGSLTLDANGMLAGFHEKVQRSSSGLINGGIYLLKRSLFPATPPREPESLESDYLPKWLRQGARIAVLQSHDPFIDIGTPESLAQAERFVECSGLVPAMAVGQDGCL